jgi:predicted solute-binding protein
MKTITRPVVTTEVNAQMLRQAQLTIHEALLDGDESLQVGAKVLVHDGDVTYLSATVTAHDGDLWELTLQREDE